MKEWFYYKEAYEKINKPMAQQTAVEWFFDKLKNHEIQAEHFELYQQAKQMEREQMEKAYKQPLFSDCQTFDQYYNETYGK